LTREPQISTPGNVYVATLQIQGRRDVLQKQILLALSLVNTDKPSLHDITMLTVTQSASLNCRICQLDAWIRKCHTLTELYFDLLDAKLTSASEEHSSDMNP
jgi:hypothetical protein